MFSLALDPWMALHISLPPVWSHLGHSVPSEAMSGDCAVFVIQSPQCSLTALWVMPVPSSRVSCFLTGTPFCLLVSWEPSTLPGIVKFYMMKWLLFAVWLAVTEQILEMWSSSWLLGYVCEHALKWPWVLCQSDRSKKLWVLLQRGMAMDNKNAWCISKKLEKSAFESFFFIINFQNRMWCLTLQFHQSWVRSKQVDFRGLGQQEHLVRLCLKCRKRWRDGETVHLGRALAALAKDLASVFSTHLLAHNHCKFSSKGHSLAGIYGYQTCVQCI